MGNTEARLGFISAGAWILASYVSGDAGLDSFFRMCSVFSTTATTSPASSFTSTVKGGLVLGHRLQSFTDVIELCARRDGFDDFQGATTAGSG